MEHHLAMRSICLYVALAGFFRCTSGTLIDHVKGVISNGVNAAVDQAKMSSDLIEEQCMNVAGAIDLPELRMPNINKMQFHYITPCCNYSVPISQADSLWKITRFKANRKLVLVASGWRTTYKHSEPIDVLAKAFACRSDVNFLAVDVHNYLNMLYTWSALNVNFIGDYIGYGLMKLASANPNVEIHLIGHSLGSHIVGSAGRKFQSLTGHQVDRITGLDPARPCFQKRMNIRGLSHADAKFVDIVHTNSGVLGANLPIGHVDFYPGGGNAMMPGCLFIDCSHSRSYEYFAESVYPGQEANFLSSRCHSTKEMKTTSCNPSTTVMGYMVSREARGIYSVRVNEHSPFGTNTKETATVDLQKGSDQCKCRGVSCTVPLAVNIVSRAFL